MNTKHKGELAELKTIMFLKQNRFSVSLPYGENCPYDFIAEAPNGHLFRIQCRTLLKVKNAFLLSLRAISKNYVRTVKLDRIDIFAGVYGDRIFFIPKYDVAGMSSVFSIHDAHPKNNQKSGIHMAHDYEQALGYMML